ncbi:MAG: hypothetical protein ACHQQ3_09195 [Gemmatimonadales bacterium]
MTRGTRAARRGSSTRVAWLAMTACLCLVVAGEPVVAQAGRGAAGDSARADSARRAERTGSMPAGFGSLRRDDIAIKVQILGLTVTAIPLDESVIRTLSPDSYQALHRLRESKAKQLDSIRTRMGIASVEAWYVLFYNQQQGEARFDPSDFLIRSAGRDFRPLTWLQLKPGFGDGRLAQRAQQDAIYVFDPQVDLTQPLTVTIGTQESSTWGDVLQLIESERSRIWSRSAAAKP